jgi:hypothetical protein
MHLLRPESITPIGLYLERHRQHPDSFEAQLDFATVLLYREREYRVMNQSRWLRGDTPPPAPAADSPFAPFDLTDAAAAIVRSAIAAGPDYSVQPDDLFGLKPDAAAGLRAVLRPVRTHRAGWAVYAWLLVDLCRSREAIDAAEQAIRLGETLSGLVMIYQATAFAAHGPDGFAEAERTMREVEARGRRLLSKRAMGSKWAMRAQEAFQERIRQRAIRTRARVEGTAFTRYIMTELAFCQQERKAAHVAFDAARVPQELRHLVPLARAIGVGDDPCRGLFIKKMPVRERREAARRIRESAGAIDAWLAGLGGSPFEGEAAAFFWLQEAADELEPA